MVKIAESWTVGEKKRCHTKEANMYIGWTIYCLHFTCFAASKKQRNSYHSSLLFVYQSTNYLWSVSLSSSRIKMWFAMWKEIANVWAQRSPFHAVDVTFQVGFAHWNRFRKLRRKQIPHHSSNSLVSRFRSVFDQILANVTPAGPYAPFLNLLVLACQFSFVSSLLLPKCPSDLLYHRSCPSVRDSGSRVSGLVPWRMKAP